MTPRNGHEKSSLIDPIQQIPDDIRSDRTSRVMISMMGMIHLIRLDNPQYYLRKFCDVPWSGVSGLPGPALNSQVTSLDRSALTWALVNGPPHLAAWQLSVLSAVI